jgi:hypothetical protein
LVKGNGFIPVSEYLPGVISASSKAVIVMAGLGLFKQKSARALAPRDLLQSAYVFCALKPTQKAPGQASRKMPGQFFTYARSYTQKNVFWVPQ